MVLDNKDLEPAWDRVNNLVRLDIHDQADRGVFDYARIDIHYRVGRFVRNRIWIGIGDRIWRQIYENIK